MMAATISKLSLASAFGPEIVATTLATALSVLARSTTLALADAEFKVRRS